MATREERLQAAEARQAQIEDPQITTGEEFARLESLRFARTFGTALPDFRTVVRLRFHGTGIDGHDLRGTLAGGVVTRIVDAVKAAGAGLKSVGPDALELFLSPTVGAGSAILELYGPPRPAAEATFDSEILDTPVDAALSSLFGVLDSVDDTAPGVVEPQIEGTLGKHLFQLTNDLLKGDVDLDLVWSRPRGSVRSTQLSRQKSRYLHDILDRETTSTTSREGRGVLTQIALDGPISIRLADTKRAVPITTEGFTPEDLRPLWAREVLATWTETTVNHPQRDTKKTVNALVNIQIAPAANGDQPTLEG